MSLSSRLTASFVAILLAGLFLFGAVAVIAMDRTLRTSLDARLRTAAVAAASFVDVRKGRIAIDADDREQFLDVTGSDLGGVVLDGANTIVLSTVTRPPSGIGAMTAGSTEFATLGHGQNVVRAFAYPLKRNGRQLGTVVIWRGSEWIAEADRNAIVAFAAGALLIAGLALFAGNGITRRALEDAFARQRRFTADASHELRAPLAVIRAESDLALRKERSPGEYRSAISTIAAEADRIESLIVDLLAAARAESRTLKRERVNVAELIGDVCARLRPAAAAKGAAVEITADGDARVLADRTSLERAMLAIGHNAVKHARANGRVNLAVVSAAGEIEICVRDDGPGFSAEALQHAFERFWRDDAGRSHGGTGLGLPIAKATVEAFGGKIALLNVPDGEGAEVRIRFPSA
jgi:signal transduction histidine kinase